MDPEARRAVWDLIISLRRDKTVLLTTHYMDEADAVGDKIAIMSAGEVKAFGSPIFLKRLFGSGYQLRMAKGIDFKAQETEVLVHKYFPKCRVLSDVETELQFSLENVSADGGHDNSKFPNFFRELESTCLGVTSCGLSMTTMEEVFLKVGRLDEEEDEDSNDGHEASISGTSGVSGQDAGAPPLPLKDGQVSEVDTRSMSSTFKTNSSTNNLLSLERECHHAPGSLMRLVQQIRGLALKRLHFSRRYWQSLIFQIIVPAAVFGLLLYLDNYLKSTPSDDPHELKIDLRSIYGQSVGFFKNCDNRTTSTDVFGKKFYGTECEKEGVNQTVLGYDFSPDDFLITSSENITIQDYSHDYLVGATTDLQGAGKSRGRLYEIWYNNEAVHAIPASINLVYKAIQGELMDSHGQGSNDSTIEVSNHPFPSEQEYLSVLFLTQALRLVWTIIVPMTVPFLAASYVLFPAHESNSKSKLLQTMTGVRPLAYWAVNWAFDLISHLIASLVIFAVLMLLDLQQVFVIYSGSKVALALLLLTFGLATQPLAYLMSLTSPKPATAFSLMVIVYLLLGVITSIVMFFFKLVIGKVVSQAAYDAMSWTLKFFPIFSMSSGISKVYEVGSFATICARIPSSTLDVLCQFADSKNQLFGCCTGRMVLNQHCWCSVEF